MAKKTTYECDRCGKTALVDATVVPRGRSRPSSIYATTCSRKHHEWLDYGQQDRPYDRDANTRFRG